MRFPQLPEIVGATIFLDVDGTLVGDTGDECSKETAERLQHLIEKNDVYLASNGDAHRTQQLAQKFGANCLPKLRKPFSHVALASIEKREQVIVIGDKFLTDGLFAARINAQFIQVVPERSKNEAVSVRLVYALDAVVSYIAPYMQVCRPHQWTKNLLVFAPSFFAATVFTPTIFASALVAFAAFCVAASSVYVLNDISDRSQDAAHPRKRRRPLASGRLSVFSAYMLLVCLLAIEGMLLFTFPQLTPIMLAYIGLNILYTRFLKQIAVIDIMLVASFYVMRIVAGGIMVGALLSPWIVLCVFFGALFLAIGKRRAEFRHVTRRHVLTQYSPAALDFMLAGAGALSITTYAFYTVLSGYHAGLVYSTFFVVLALFAIMNRMYTHENDAETPEHLVFKDPVVFLSLLGWSLYVFAFFYLI